MIQKQKSKFENSLKRQVKLAFFVILWYNIRTFGDTIGNSGVGGFFMKYMKVALVGLLVFLGVMFSVFSLDEKGFKSSRGIYYDNIDYTDNVTFNSVDGTSIDYSAQLTKPGDYYEVMFDVVNSTSYDVEIADHIYNKDDDYIEYRLTYDNGKTINNGDVIKSGETRRIKYRVYYKDYILDNNYSFDSSFYIYYEQVI